MRPWCGAQSLTYFKMLSEDDISFRWTAGNSDAMDAKCPNGSRYTWPPDGEYTEITVDVHRWQFVAEPNHLRAAIASPPAMRVTTNGVSSTVRPTVGDAGTTTAVTHTVGELPEITVPVGGSCGGPTVPNAYLTADVAQPSGWQRPVAIPWQKGITANDCYHKCVENRSFPCRAFVLEEHPSFGAQCWISSHDRAMGVTVSPSLPNSRYVRNYWEVSACGSGTAGRQPSPQTGSQNAPPPPPPPSATAFDCRCLTMANSYLTADVAQPRGWQRPVAIPWQKGVTANDCYRKCVENRNFTCRAFVLEEHPSFGAQCWISSLDRATGVTVSPSSPDSRYVRNYWELEACRPDRQCPAQEPPPSPTGDCHAPTLANAYLTADVRQPPGWERPVAIPWQKGITANDCYRKCVENRDFKCRAFVLEQHPKFGAQCWISSLDRAGGVTVSPSLASSNYIRNYWEVRDCQPGGSGPAAPPPVSATGPRPAPAAPAGCADPRTLGFMDEWLARAVPVPAGAYRFDNWGRIIGQNDSTRVRNINQPVDPYTWATRCNYLWSIAASMNSRNLGTMLSYVQGRLAGR